MPAKLGMDGAGVAAALRVTRPPSWLCKLLAVKGQAASKEDDDARQRGILGS